jgi:hypothetical protein
MNFERLITSDRELDWHVIEQAGGERRLAKWRRSVAVDLDGEIWVPAVYAANELAVVRCISPNSHGAILRDSHIYVRASWMRRAYPKTIELLDKIRRQLRVITDRQNDRWLSYCLRCEDKRLQ